MQMNQDESDGWDGQEGKKKVASFKFNIHIKSRDSSISTNILLKGFRMAQGFKPAKASSSIASKGKGKQKAKPGPKVGGK